jgi:tRNA (guanine-N7-)-methyltransferase
LGKNKLKKFEDLGSWEHVFEFARYDDFFVDNPLKGKWSERVFGNNNPIVLELGCGKGEYTVALAELYPEKNFIGIDIKGSRLWTGALDVKEKGLKNAVFLRTHIEFINRFFESGEVSEIWLTFPDPQMKKLTKRLTSTGFLQSYKNILSTDGVVHLKTDSNFMYLYTSEVLKVNKLEVLFNTDDLYHSEWTDKILSIQTFYEKQWLTRGLSIKYLQFKLNIDSAFTEPDVEIEPDPYRSFGRKARNIQGNVEPI